MPWLPYSVKSKGLTLKKKDSCPVYVIVGQPVGTSEAFAGSNSLGVSAVKHPIRPGNRQVKCIVFPQASSGALEKSLLTIQVNVKVPRSQI